jgi:N-acetylglutamate synthase-like GNAT family acetyltransferase
LEIRRARPEDKDSIREIYCSAAGRHASLDGARRDQLIEAGALLVAEERGRVIAFGSIEVSAEQHVRWLYVLPRRQKGGVGSELLKRLERIGWEAGLNSIRLHAAPASAGFYRRNGYEEVAGGERVGHDHDGVEMVKERRRERGVGEQGASPIGRA